MTIIFASKHNDTFAEVPGVKFFTTDTETLGDKGYGVHYEDGTFSLYSYKSWELAMVKQ